MESFESQAQQQYIPSIARELQGMHTSSEQNLYLASQTPTPNLENFPSFGKKALSLESGQTEPGARSQDYAATLDVIYQVNQKTQDTQRASSYGPPLQAPQAQSLNNYAIPTLETWEAPQYGHGAGVFSGYSLVYAQSSTPSSYDDSSSPVMFPPLDLRSAYVNGS